MSDSLEYVILTKRECFAYQVKAAAVGGGFKAGDWGNCVWKGRLQVAAKDQTLIIKLVSTDGNIFVACPISADVENFMERTVDSSRYFVLKLSPTANNSASGSHPKKALLGFGFDDRNDAFDFNACVQDFFADTHNAQLTKRDFTLKEGQKISVGNLLKPLVVSKPEDDWFDFQHAPLPPQSTQTLVPSSDGKPSNESAKPTVNLLDF